MIKIYCDTNILERRLGKKGVILDSKFFMPDLYKLLEYIRENNLIDKVNVIIPQIVIEEMTQHIKDSYKANMDSLIDDMKKHKSIFGENISFDYNLIYDMELYLIEYNKEIDNLIEKYEFFKVEIVECSISKLIDRAVNKFRPFQKAIKNGKEYTDAGFKDVVFLETALENCADSKNVRVILFTNDNDFADLNKENIEITTIKTLSEILQEMDRIFKIESETLMTLQFKDEYFKNHVLMELGCDKFDVNTDSYIVKRVYKAIEGVEDSIYVININIIYNETNIDATVIFDAVANEVIDVYNKHSND